MRHGDVTLFGSFTTILCVIVNWTQTYRPPLEKGYGCLILLRGSYIMQCEGESERTLNLHTCSVDSVFCKKQHKFITDNDDDDDNDDEDDDDTRR